MDAWCTIFRHHLFGLKQKSNLTAVLTFFVVVLKILEHSQPVWYPQTSCYRSQNQDHAQSHWQGRNRKGPWPLLHLTSPTLSCPKETQVCNHFWQLSSKIHCSLVKVYFKSPAIKVLSVSTKKNTARTTAAGEKFSWNKITQEELYKHTLSLLECIMSILKLWSLEVTGVAIPSFMSPTLKRSCPEINSTESHGIGTWMTLRKMPPVTEKDRDGLQSCVPPEDNPLCGWAKLESGWSFARE